RVQAGERAFEALDAGEQVFLRNERLVHHHFARDRGAQAELAVDRGRRQALGALLDEEAAYLSVLGLRPDDEQIGNRRVADPGLGAGEAVAARDFLRPRLHARGVGAVVGLGEAEAADQLAPGELREIFLLVRLGAEFVDRRHHERALHAHGRAVTRVDALELP